MWSQLPADLLACFAPFLATQDLFRLSCVCKSWRDAIQSEEPYRVSFSPTELWLLQEIWRRHASVISPCPHTRWVMPTGIALRKRMNRLLHPSSRNRVRLKAVSLTRPELAALWLRQRSVELERIGLAAAKRGTTGLRFTPTCLLILFLYPCCSAFIRPGLLLLQCSHAGSTGVDLS